MYNNPYYNQNNYMQDLQNMRDRIDKQMQQMQQPINNQQPTPITQNFQLAPNQNNNGIKYVENDEQVENELTFAETLFINKEFTTLWIKNASGNIKKYELKEIVKLDEKDLIIAKLQAQIEELKGDSYNVKQSVNVNDDTTDSSKKSTGISNSKSSNK